jgi:type IV secretory pathway VirD2 relaxase
MPKTLLDLRNRPLLDIVSHGRGGPKGSLRLSADQIAAIDRTVRRVPEVMVKVLPKDSNNLRSAARHLNYIGRYGKLGLETDDGERIQGKDAGRRLLEDWDLDLEKDRRETKLAAVTGRSPKLVHKIMLSMPPGTPAKCVLEAARNFAREEFALKHRYALVLHTDEPHPHVHLVVKAVSDQGVRLNIRKATLREWRREFARLLRDQGIAANATERAVRGETQTPKLDGIYRAAKRGDSTHTRARVETLASELLSSLRTERGKSKLLQTREEVERGWRTTSDILLAQGHPDLAARARRFLTEIPPPMTEKEVLAAALEQARQLRSYIPQNPRTR